MATMILGAVGGVPTLAAVAALGFKAADAAVVVGDYVRARQGLHRHAHAQQWSMCHGSPRVRRARPVTSHRVRRAT